MAKAPATKNTLEIDWIRELAGILDETGLTEIEIEKSDVRVRVSRATTAAAQTYFAPAAAGPIPAAQATPAPVQATSPEGAPAGAVKSPMVGTIYLSPSPETGPFVKVGDSVSEGQTLMIVEAMKTMNPVASPRAGTVREILVRNEQPVEFDEPLLIIE